MSVLGIIFSNIHDMSVPDLTRERTIASMPFGGRYRLIDFVLSNMVNAGITKIGVITKTKYQSLMRHVGSGKDWDLSRKYGGLFILPPFGDVESSSLYENRLEALKGAAGFIEGATEEYIIMSDCDIIANLPLYCLIETHKKNGADITGMYQTVQFGGSPHRSNVLLELDGDNRVTDIAVYRESEEPCEKNLSLNTWIMKRTLLQSIVYNAIAHGQKSFTNDVLAPNLNNMKVCAIKYSGYFACIDSLPSYLKCNLDLLDPMVRTSIFGQKYRPIYTRVKDSNPTTYGYNAKVKNAFIADGCYIDGTVENSVLFRGVRIGKNCVVRNSVLMQDTMLGENVTLNAVITDKRVVFKDSRNLSGHETQPFYIKKGTMI